MANPLVERNMPEPQASGSPGTQWAAAAVGAALGALVTVPAVIAALISGGFGHGNFIAFKMLYPIPLLLANIFETIAPAMLLLGLIQFPLYGALLFIGKRRSTIALAALLVLHVLAVIACFMPDLNFIFY